MDHEGHQIARWLNGLGVTAVILKYRLGPKLTLNPKRENFNGHKEANAMLTREYRKGFEVPNRV